MWNVRNIYKSMVNSRTIQNIVNNILKCNKNTNYISWTPHGVWHQSTPGHSRLVGVHAESRSHDQNLPALDTNSLLSLFFAFFRIYFTFLYLLQFLSKHYGKITTILRIFKNLLAHFFRTDSTQSLPKVHGGLCRPNMGLPQNRWVIVMSSEN